MIRTLLFKIAVSLVLLFSTLTSHNNYSGEVFEEHDHNKNPQYANQSYETEEVVVSETFLVFGDGLDCEKCKLCDSINDQNRGPIENCFNNHLIYYTGLDGTGHTSTGVTVYIDNPAYISATYIFYRDTGVSLYSNSFSSGTTFYYPGIYYFSVRCICNQVYTNSFTIMSCDYTINNYSASQNGQPLANCSYILTNTFSFTKGSIFGHVQSIIDFPYEQGAGGYYGSLLQTADYFDLYYSCVIDRSVVRFKPDSICTILYEYTYYAQYGFSYYDPYPYLGTYSFEAEADVEDFSVPLNNVHDVLFMKLNYFCNIGNTANSSYPINNIGLTITIDFDIQSNIRLDINTYMPINGLTLLGIDFVYDFIYAPTNTLDTEIYYNTCVFLYVVTDYTISTVLNLIPKVGTLLSLGYTYLMYYVGDELQISSGNHIRLVASINFSYEV